MGFTSKSKWLLNERLLNYRGIGSQKVTRHETLQKRETASIFTFCYLKTPFVCAQNFQTVKSYPLKGKGLKELWEDLLILVTRVIQA